FARWKMANSVQHVSLVATGEVFLFSVCCIRQGNAICATLNHERWHRDRLRCLRAPIDVAIPIARDMSAG
ncbi:MAG: hypothetical protein WCD62_02855, partial [Pseudolabrys sp.]